MNTIYKKIVVSDDGSRRIEKTAYLFFNFLDGQKASDTLHRSVKYLRARTKSENSNFIYLCDQVHSQAITFSSSVDFN